MHAAPFRSESIRPEGSKVFLDGYVSNLMEKENYLRPFSKPSGGDDDRSLFEAALVHNGCMEALMYLHGFSKALLADGCFEIEEVNVTPIKPKFQVIPVLKYNGRKIDIPDMTHNAYKITLKSGEAWAIDPSGAQFGYTSPLDPWHVFERSNKFNGSYDFGYIHHTAYKEYGSGPMRGMVIQKVEKNALGKILEQEIPALLAQKHGRKLSDILKGSDATFKKTKDRFLEQLENCLKVSMMKLYSREQIIKMKNEVDKQLALNMVDPDGPRRLQEHLELVMSIR